MGDALQKNVAFKSSIKKCFKCNGFNHIAEHGKNGITMRSLQRWKQGKIL